MSGPVKKSSVHHLFAKAGARMEIRHGWEIPLASDAAGLTDVSWLGKLECKGDWVESLKGMAIEGARPYELAASRLLWIVQPEHIEKAALALEQARSGRPRSYLIDVSSVYASL